MDNRAYVVVRAYVNYAGVPGFDKKKFANFLADNPMVREEFSPQVLEDSIRKFAGAFIDDVDPVVNREELKSYVESTRELDTFFSSIPGSRLSNYIQHLREFPFKESTSKHIVRKALLTVYGADNLADPANLEQGLDNKLTDIAGPDAAMPAPVSTEESPADLAAEPQQTPAEALPPDVDEKALHTIENYLMKDVFSNKIIPIVKIIEAWKLQSGYVIKVEFASQDGTTKAYTTAVIHNDLLVLPAELEGEDGSKLGEFNKETLLQTFAVEGSSPRDTDNYQDLMGQMLKAPAPVVGQILRKIKIAHGADQARIAFDAYTRIKFRKQAEENLGGPARLDVALSAPTLYKQAHPEAENDAKDEVLLKIQDKIAKSQDGGNKNV